MSFDFNDTNVRDVGKESGRAFAEGLGVGMSEGSYDAITAMEDVYVVLESLTKNAAKNAERLQKKQRERSLNNLKNALKLELVTEQEYYEKLKVFRDENLKQGTDMWYKCTEEIAAYNKRLLDETQKQFEKMMQLRAELSEKLSEKLQGKEPWANSSRITFKGIGPNGSDLVYNDTELKNFREEILLLENYRDRLLELKALENIPDGVFADISAMSVEKGLQAANAILIADDKMRNEFFAGYSNHKSAADSISAELLDLLYGNVLGESGPAVANSQPKSTIAAKNNFTQLLEASFDEVPESYRALGEDAGGAFGDGFLSKIPEVMENMRNYFVAAINQLGARLAATLRDTAQSVATGDTYNTTYTFNSSKDTTTEQLNAAKNAATLERLRGGNGI